MNVEISRRGFLKGAAATGATMLLVGVTPNGALSSAGTDGGNLTPFVKITPDGSVTAIIKHFEMGQGTSTGLSSLIAEELGVNIEDVGYEFAPSDPARYANLIFKTFQATGGSTAMANSFMQYRQAGAAAREMLINAAAAEWGVPAGQLSLQDGVISGAGKSAPLSRFVVAAAALDVPAEPKLKDPSEFRVIGNPNTRRRDTPSKIDGTAKYAMDVQLDGQLVVVLKRTPRLGGKVAAFDASAAKQVPAFVNAVTLPTGNAVAVYATNTWAAFQARDAVSVEWDFSEAENRSSGQVRQELLAAVNKEPEFIAGAGSDLAVTEAALAGADQVVEHEFYFPMLANAPMEPLTCTIEPVEDGIVLHDGAQVPTASHQALSQILQLELGQIRINTMFAGGSFGRRASADVDYQVEAGLAFAMTDRTRPVKLVWSREDDITGGYYRPAVAHKVRVGLDAVGKIVGWDHRIACSPIYKGTALNDVMVHNGVDHTSVEGVYDTLYKLPGFFTGLTDAKPAASASIWRSVGNSHTGYVMECMMDAAARAAGIDPVEFRLEYLSDGGPDQARIAGVLKLAAEKAGWGSAAEGRSQGIAVHKSFGSYVAEVAEISRDEDGYVKIERVTCAVDCGVPVNPDVIEAQMEGGIGYGIGHVMRNEITLEGGEIVQSNFPDYESLRIGDIGAIDVHIVPSTEAPTGVGEPGTPPAGPALANAIAVSGPRVTFLPLANNGIDFA